MIYYIRHGQTDANLKQIHAGGEWDLPLNNTGRQQAIDLGEKEKDFFASFDKVFVSPMARARETAELVTKGTKELNTIHDLREWELGDGSGEPINDDLPPFLLSLKTPRNGESFEVFQQRCLNAMRSIASQSKGKTLIVAHGGVWSCYAHFVKHPKIELENCTLIEIDR
ncbi:MAG: histidine phosphatase family protein, partial [Pseudomonadota bacterium]